MVSPVCGLRPWRAERSEIPNLPKPDSATSLPEPSWLAICSSVASIASLAWLLLRPVSSATARARSVLLMDATAIPPDDGFGRDRKEGCGRKNCSGAADDPLAALHAVAAADERDVLAAPAEEHVRTRPAVQAVVPAMTQEAVRARPADPPPTAQGGGPAPPPRQVGRPRRSPPAGRSGARRGRGARRRRRPRRWC